MSFRLKLKESIKIRLEVIPMMMNRRLKCIKENSFPILINMKDILTFQKLMKTSMMKAKAARHSNKK